MKFSIISVLALATAAMAAPAEVVARNGGGSGGGTTVDQCNNEQTNVCCASLLGLTCLVDILGGNCNGGSYCCETGASTGGLININALNCVQLL